MQNDKYDIVHKILQEWNPIGVPEPALFTEYESYVNIIISKAENRDSLFKYLEILVSEIIGLHYDSTNQSHRDDIREVTNRIIHGIKNNI